MGLLGKLFGVNKNDNPDFPFSDAKNTITITCCHVIDEHHAILYASHDEDDGMWQFLCGETHDTEEGRIVSLEEIFMRDRSISVLATLPYGCEAWRKDENSDWTARRKQT